MRIEVARSGGFAGLIRRAEVETAGRPDAARLEALARTALADARGTTLRPVVPDGFVYRVSVDGEPFRCADPHVTPAQRALVQAVLEQGVADAG